MGVLKGRVRKSFIQPVLFLTVGPPPPGLVQISFSPQPSAVIKIKDGDHNFHEENPKHSLAKITPAMQNCVLFSAHFINAVDLSFYRFTGVITHVGCWKNTRKVCSSHIGAEWLIKCFTIKIYDQLILQLDGSWAQNLHRSRKAS